ncbi:MAG TPA: hypothetical protein VF414_04625, partial [Thermoanaerobaculia bacterium]
MGNAGTVALLFVLAWGIPPGPASSQTALLDAVATIGFDDSALSGLGLELEVVGPRIARHAPHPLSVAPPDATTFGPDGPIGLRAAISAGGFQGFADGSLRLRGGFRLRGAARSFDFSSLELRPGKKAFS